MRNPCELEILMVERSREKWKEAERDRLIRRAKKEGGAALRPAPGRLRVRLGLLLIHLGARLAEGSPETGAHVALRYY